MPHLTNARGDATSSMLPNCFATEQARSNDSASSVFRMIMRYDENCNKILQWLEDVATSIRAHKAQQQYTEQKRRVGQKKHFNGLTPKEQKHKEISSAVKAQFRQAEKLFKEIQSGHRNWSQFSISEQLILTAYRRGEFHKDVLDMRQSQNKPSPFRMKKT